MTREQHIRREKANEQCVHRAKCCLPSSAGMYAVWHGPERLTVIARHIHSMAALLAAGLAELGLSLTSDVYFDTISVEMGHRSVSDVIAAARARAINLRALGTSRVIIALDETTRAADVDELLEIFAAGQGTAPKCEALAATHGRALRRAVCAHLVIPHAFRVQQLPLRDGDAALPQRLESKDLSLTTSMIALGSCTMKLNATAEMYPVTWPEFGKIHPFAPVEQAKGYQEMFERLDTALAEITGFAGISLQPNAGSQGRIRRPAGDPAVSRVARRYPSHGLSHSTVRSRDQSRERGDGGNESRRRQDGRQRNIDVADLEEKAKANAQNLAALMVTYPSTHGVLRGSDHRQLSHRPSVRWPGLSGWREHERDGRSRASGRHRRGRVPSQLA